MKITFLILSFLLLFSFDLKSQLNLIPNPGFESGSGQAKCDYGTDDDYQTASTSDDPIQTDIYYWRRATCKGFNVGPFSSTCQYQYSSPDWMDPNFCSGLVFGFQSKYVYLEKRNQNGYQDALRTGLLTHMNLFKNYIFKINYTAIARKNGSTGQSGPARTTIYFTEYSTNWSANWGNTKLWFEMYPPSAPIGPNNPTGWQQHWHVLKGTIINSHPFFGNVFNKLNNIVLDCSSDQVLIDYVELSENCANNLLIENHEFSPFANEIPYKSSNLIKAGYNVGNPSANGNVVVKSGASATFKAGLQIYLEPGFIAEPNSNFKTVIEPCNSNTARTIEDTIEIIDEKTIKIGDTYIYDDSQETLACNDTLVINGLDGDTTSFINYFWDFGNGQTSDNPVATVYYTDPGEYLVQLILTDSSGVVDTLSKLYIVPDCNRIGGTSSNNIAGLNIYPNPNNGQFIIDIEDVNINNFVEIYDLTGRLIWQKIVLETKTTIDISNQPKGIYMVKLISGNKVYTQKLVYQ